MSDHESTSTSAQDQAPPSEHVSEILDWLDHLDLEQYGRELEVLFAGIRENIHASLEAIEEIRARAEQSEHLIPSALPVENDDPEAFRE
jgi:hypothetical protein